MKLDKSYTNHQCHSREGGNPGWRISFHNIDSRLRGNDKAGV